MKLTTEWYKRKISQIQRRMDDENIEAMLLLDPFNIFYSTGFFHQPTERPLGLLIALDKDPELYVPLLEKDAASEESWIKNIKSYFDYPGDVDPVIWMLEENRHYKNITADKVDAAELLKIRSVFPEFKLSDIIYDIRLIKDPEEIEIVKTAAVYADYMVEMIRDAAQMGMSELDNYNYAREKTAARMKAELGELPFANLGMSNGVVIYREHTAFPHGLMNPGFYPVPGCNIQPSIGVLVCAYEAECERTMFYGEPSKEQVFYFETMRKAWQAGLEAAKPGVRCCDVNKASLDQIRAAGCEKYLRHRMGHGKGIEEHENPYIEEGDMTILQPGMLISDEPGLYVPGLGGFRHSDTVYITETGAVTLTHFPRDLEQCIIPVSGKEV